MSSIVLYDLDRKGRRACWSPNTWKIRLVLNFKNLDYETRWLEFPDIAPTLEAQKITKAPYTVPAILLDSSSSGPVPFMDSLPIAHALEKAHPKPSLHLDAPVLSEVEALTGQFMKLIGPIALPMSLREVMNPPSAEFKEQQLVPLIGMSIDQFENAKGGEPAWERLQGPLEKMAGLLKKEEGPFILGHEVSYADFVIAAFLQCGKRVGDGAMYDRIIAVDPAFQRLYAATEKWAKRDDH